jgi:serine phosphatase RsbU (regulator of sigma subunit)
MEQTVSGETAKIAAPGPTIKHTNTVVTVKSIVLFTILTILNIGVFVFIAFENQIDLIARNAELEIRDRGLRLKLKIEQVVTGLEIGRPQKRYETVAGGVRVYAQPDSSTTPVSILEKGQTVFSVQAAGTWHRIMYSNAQHGWVRTRQIVKHTPAWQTGALSPEDVRLIMGILDAEEIRQYTIFLEDGTVVLDSRQNDRAGATTQEMKWIERMIFRSDFEGLSFSHDVNIAEGSIDLYLPVYYSTGKLLVIKPTIGMNYIAVQKNFLYRQCLIVGILIFIVHIFFVLLNHSFVIIPMVRERVTILRDKNRQIKLAHKKLNETHDQLRDTHRELAKAHDAIEKELDLAREIQLSLIPSSPPKIPGYTFVATYLPAEKVGGDYYDFLALENNQLGVLIADASGHGIPAALLVSMAKITFSNPVLDLGSPSFMLEQTNITLKKAILTHHFLTAFYLVLDIASGSIRYARAGHPPVLIYRAQTQSVEELQVRGIALGLVDNPSFEQKETTLEPGDRMVLYSDGIIESFNPDRTMYGVQTLKKVLQTYGRIRPKEIIVAILDDLRRFTDNQKLPDDATLLVIGRDKQEAPVT